MNLILSVLIWAAHAGSTDQFVPCDDVLRTGVYQPIPRASFTDQLDRIPDVWTVYRSTDSAANLIMFIAGTRAWRELPQLVVAASGISALLPGKIIRGDPDAHWMTLDDANLITESLDLSPPRRERLLRQLTQPSACAPDTVDGIAVLEDPGSANESLWSASTLRFVNLMNADCDVLHADAAVLLGLRTTLRPLTEWMVRPLDLIARTENTPGATGLPPAALAKIAAIYVVPSITSPRARRVRH